jgi:hypothetical protein
MSSVIALVRAALELSAMAIAPCERLPGDEGSELLPLLQQQQQQQRQQ